MELPRYIDNIGQQRSEQHNSPPRVIIFCLWF